MPDLFWHLFNNYCREAEMRLKEKTDNREVRLNKFLSDAGVCSRREADRLTEAGKITINGEVAVLGGKVTDTDVVKVNGEEVSREEEQIIIAFNKPEGIECTAQKDNPDNIIDYIGYEKRIYPIGRLDKNSRGLILLTNDGSIVNGILKASNFHEKEYIVTVDKEITGEFIEAMSSGVTILDGVKTRPCEVKKTKKHEFNIVLTQGLNRQIRRMCKTLGYNVTKLQRVRVMNVELGTLGKGKYRNLTDKEVKDLLDQIKDSNGDTDGQN